MLQVIVVLLQIYHMNKYRIEIWDRTVNKYIVVWTGTEYYANVMYNKSYINHHTRRLIQITETIIKRDKGNK